MDDVAPPPSGPPSSTAPQPPAPPPPPAKSGKRPLRSMLEMVVIVAAAVFFALTIQAFAVKPYRIPSGSMLPTLEPGQRILVDRFSHLTGSNPSVGDITVFTPPKGADTNACGIVGQGPFYGGGGGPASWQGAAPGQRGRGGGESGVGGGREGVGGGGGGGGGHRGGPGGPRDPQRQACRRAVRLFVPRPRVQPRG